MAGLTIRFSLGQPDGSLLRGLIYPAMSLLGTDVNPRPTSKVLNRVTMTTIRLRTIVGNSRHALDDPPLHRHSDKSIRFATRVTNSTIISRGTTSVNVNNSLNGFRLNILRNRSELTRNVPVLNMFGDRLRHYF